MKKWIKKHSTISIWLGWCVLLLGTCLTVIFLQQSPQEVKEQVVYVVECEYLVFTKAPDDCDFVERVHIPINMVDGAIIEEVGWKCETTLELGKDGLRHTLHYTVYHIYRPGVYGWFVEEDPIAMLAERKAR